jgi:hypothetical protein
MELMHASRQWASRPADQRFTSLTELHSHVQNAHDNSRSKVMSSRQLVAAPVEGDHRALVVVGPDGAPVAPTNWSFGQLCQRAKAPAGFLRDLPSALAADCINDGLHRRNSVEEIGILLYKNGGPAELRAATGPNYGRVWNRTVTSALVDHFGDGLNGTFRVPGEFGKPVPVTKANTTLYASDRDMFVFLADEQNRIEVPNRRNGQSGQMARGIFVWNSEVGSQTLGMAAFLFDYVCCNRIVWGAQGYQEIRIRHTSGAPDRWIEEAMPAIEAYREESTTGLVESIRQAQRKRIENVDEFLLKRFSKPQVSAIKAAHMEDEQRPIESLWDVATGVTAYARAIQYQDQRVDLEREAGKIMKLAA